jgi:hypothetical protein
MRLKNSAFRQPLLGLILLAACSSDRKGREATSGTVIIDHEARTYVESKLRPYLDWMAQAACGVRASAAPTAGRYGICVPASKRGPGVEPLEGDPKGQGVTVPPKDGRPYPPPDSLKPIRGDSVDNEVRLYIENDLRPYLSSLATVTCAERAAASPRAGRNDLCPEAQGITPPPVDGRPYPPGDKRPPAADNELRNYIENDLRPYVTSLAKVACGVRVVAASTVDGSGICVPFAANTPGVVRLDEGPEGEGVTVPPRDGRPYPVPGGTPGGNPPRP